MSITAFLPLYVQGAMGLSPGGCWTARAALLLSAGRCASVAAGRLISVTSYRWRRPSAARSDCGTLVLMTLWPASAPSLAALAPS